MVNSRKLAILNKLDEVLVGWDGRRTRRETEYERLLWRRREVVDPSTRSSRQSDVVELGVYAPFRNVVSNVLSDGGRVVSDDQT